MKIVFLPNGIGDTLMLVPALQRLIAVHGAEGVAVVVASTLHRSILHHFLGRPVHCIERYDGRPLPHLRLFLRLLRMRIDLIHAPLLSRRWRHLAFFMLLGKPISVPSSFVRRSLAWIARSTLSQATFDGHQVDYFVRFLAHNEPSLDISPVRFDELKPAGTTPASRKADRTVSHVAVGVSCGALERHKMPRPAFFAQTVNELARRIPVEVLLIGSSADLALLDEFDASVGDSITVHRLVARPVPEVLEALAYCDLGIAGTTGQGHMMAAVGLPMLVLAGVTDAYESGPYAQRVAVLRHRLPCGPCYQEAFRFGCRTVACMETLDPAEAAALAQRLLSEPSFCDGWHDGHRIGPVPVARIRWLHASSAIAGPSTRQEPAT
jgi:ADP-heptose:LPS heptosyltransferase